MNPSPEGRYSPSPEAIEIAELIIGTLVVRDLAEIVDERLAPHREQVRRLVNATSSLADIADELRNEIIRLVGFDDSHGVPDPQKEKITEARAALAPFLEQKNVTP